MFTQITATAETQGLLIKAAFAVVASDRVPALENGEPAETLILIGNAGAAMWPQFIDSPEYHDAQPDPLDRWSLRLGRRMAREFGGRALFPCGGPPFYPFLSWARRGDLSVSSPLGLALHPRYGLWHAFRFALVLPYRLQGLPSLAQSTQPGPAFNACLHCVEQPCLSACPVEAFSAGGYQHLCCAHFLSQDPEHGCNKIGCAARRACPEGKRYKYPPAQARFHMQAFVAQYASLE